MRRGRSRHRAAGLQGRLARAGALDDLLCAARAVCGEAAERSGGGGPADGVIIVTQDLAELLLEAAGQARAAPVLASPSS